MYVGLYPSVPLVELDLYLRIHPGAQGQVGDVEGDRPSGFDFRGAAKFDSWEKRRGMSSDEAMQAYIDLVDELAAG